MAATVRAERWIWLEPIGFDNTQADYGVAEYIFTERTGNYNLRNRFKNGEYFVDVFFG